MSNTWFQFKQFIIYQEKCAMKVCTDSCIFGAFTALQERDKCNDETKILDIGTGTGLLSLMTAQKVKGNIDAVEIDENAYEQATENFKNSKWTSRLSVFHADIFKIDLGKKYDLIISNPPFFKESLQSSDDQKNFAKHNISFSYAKLAAIVYLNLADKGRFYILLPFKEFKTFEKIAARNKLTLIRKKDIKSSISSAYFRTIGVFTNDAGGQLTSEILIIKDNNNEYTADFINLMKDYYLYL